MKLKWCCLIALWVALFAISCLAADYVGSLVGWLIGASKSPIAKAIAPLVFGLLGVLGVREALRHKARRVTKTKKLIVSDSDNSPASTHPLDGHSAELLRGILAASMVAIFCRSCFYAVPFGIFSRIGPYKSVSVLLGDDRQNLDTETATAIYAFRLRAKAAGVTYADYEAFMVEVIDPLLKPNSRDGLDRAKKAMLAMEAAMPKPDAKKEVEPEIVE